MPAATSTKYSYSEVMGITIYSDASSAYSGLVDQAARNYQNGIMETTVYVQKGLMDSLVAMVSQQKFFDDLEAKGCSTRGWSSVKTSRSFTITLK